MTSGAPSCHILAVIKSNGGILPFYLTQLCHGVADVLTQLCFGIVVRGAVVALAPLGGCLLNSQ